VDRTRFVGTTTTEETSLALVLLKREATPRLGLPSKRLRAALSVDYLLKVLATGLPTGPSKKR
jgi:hypothetical protein